MPVTIPKRRKKYVPYQPTALEARVDSLLGVLSPKWAAGRMLNRERMNQYRYLAAEGTRERANASPTSGSGETQRGNRERQQLMWNAIELIENSGLAWSIRTKFCDYVCGTLRYQARTGDTVINNEYEDYLRVKFGKGMDVAGRKTIRSFGRLTISGMVVKGDAGINIVRDSIKTATGKIVVSKDVQFQGIEADRIGDPYAYRATQDYIGGVHLSGAGAHLGYDIFTKNRASGSYVYEETIPATNAEGMPRFMLCVNPITFDDVRGRSVFARTLDNIDYLRNIRNYELQALMWAASQSGVYHTKDGLLPQGSDGFFDAGVGEGEGSSLFTARVTPNTIQALGIGEDVSMFQHDRPSPNVIAMYRETIKDIALGCNLSFGFVYDMSGMLGGAVRNASAQDKRALITWKEQLKDDFLTPAAIIMLGNGIANKEIPPHPRWMQGEWFFPPHPTIDAGRESAADINEIGAAIRSRAMVCGEESNDADEVRREIANETQENIREAKRVAKAEKIDNWREVYGWMFPGKAIQMSPVFEGARAEQLEGAAAGGGDPAEDFATSGGAEME